MTTKANQTVPPEIQTPLQKLNAFGDRHAKVIILISSVLVIVIVVLVAKILYDRTIAERAAREIASAQSPEQLEELKLKYADSPVRAEIIYRLANKYNERGELEKAKAEYEEFKTDFGDHPLKSPFVDRAYSQVVENLRFMEIDRLPLLKIPTLQSHPKLEMAAFNEYLKNPGKENGSMDKIQELLMGPNKALTKNPLVRVNIKNKGSFVIELFENETPNSTYHLVKHVLSSAFNGTEIDITGNALTIGKPADFYLPMEKNDLKPEKFSVILRKAKDREDLSAGSFEILLRPLPKLEDAVVVGKVTEGAAILGQIKAKDKIEKASVEDKRETKYEPETITPGAKEKK